MQIILLLHVTMIQCPVVFQIDSAWLLNIFGIWLHNKTYRSSFTTQRNLVFGYVLQPILCEVIKLNYWQTCKQNNTNKQSVIYYLICYYCVEISLGWHYKLLAWIIVSAWFPQVCKSFKVLFCSFYFIKKHWYNILKARSSQKSSWVGISCVKMTCDFNSRP